MVETLAAILVSIFMGAVKNPTEKLKLKGVMLKVFHVIKTVNAGDSDFE